MELAHQAAGELPGVGAVPIIASMATSGRIVVARKPRRSRKPLPHKPEPACGAVVRVVCVNRSYRRLSELPSRLILRVFSVVAAGGFEPPTKGL